MSQLIYGIRIDKNIKSRKSYQQKMRPKGHVSPLVLQFLILFLWPDPWGSWSEQSRIYFYCENSNITRYLVLVEKILNLLFYNFVLNYLLLEGSLVIETNDLNSPSQKDVSCTKSTNVFKIKTKLLQTKCDHKAHLSLKPKGQVS